MAVLNNTGILMGSSAVTASSADEYLIEKSVRFNGVGGYFKAPWTTAGNQRTWTWSGWLKFSDIKSNKQMMIFDYWNDSNNYTLFDCDDKLRFKATSGGTQLANVVCSREIRDPTAWMHIVLAVDTSAEPNTDRVRFYINGVRETEFSTSSFPTKWTMFDMNNTIGEYTFIGKRVNSYFDGYMSDVHFIDSLSLTQFAFGRFDSTGVWVPKEFSTSTYIINDGTTWSDSLSAYNDAWGVGGGYPKSNVFDGDGTTVGGLSAFHADNFVKFEPSTAFTNVDNFEVYIDHSWTEVEYRLKSGDTWGPWRDIERGTNTGWEDCSKWIVDREVSGFEMQPSGTNVTRLYIGGFKVNGVILQDDYKDPSHLLNPHKNWDLNALVSNTASGGNMMFDGRDLGGSYANNNQTASLDLTSVGGITYTNTIRANIVRTYGSDSLTMEINGTDITSNLTINASGNEDGKWYDISSWFTGKTLNTAEWDQGNAGNVYIMPTAIEVDGFILKSEQGNNTYQLKLTDATNLGSDTLGGTIYSSAGAKPILNTEDDYGQTVSSGNRTDSDSSHLQLALPFNNSTSDVSSNSIGMTNSGSTNTTGSTKFYGNARDFDGSNDIIYNTSANSDLAWTASDNVCYEWWAKSDDTTQTAAFLVLGETAVTAGYKGFAVKMISGGFESFVSSNNSSWNVLNSTPMFIGSPDTEWHHYAWTYDATDDKVRTFFDGRLAETVNNITAAPSITENTLNIGGGSEGNNVAASYFNGQVSDFRYYKGTKKYKPAFPVPKPKNFSVHATDATDGDGYIQGSPNTSNGALIIRGPNSGAGTFYSNLFSDSSCNFVLSSNGTSWSHQGTGTVEAINGYKWIAIAGGGTATRTAALYYSLGASYAWTDSTALNISSGSVTYDATGLTYTTMPTTSIRNDLKVDSPTNGGTDTGAGNEVTGNYCTLNPLDMASDIALSEGNLKAIISDNTKMVRGTFGVQNSGKWYFEVTCDQCTNDNNKQIGIHPLDIARESYIGAYLSVGYHKDGRTLTNGGQTGSTGSTWGTGDTIGVALDLSGGGTDNGKVTFYKNGTVQSNGIVTNLDCTKHYTIAVARSSAGSGSTIFHVNTGQSAFKNTAPAGHKCLCSQNLPDTFGDNDDTNDPGKYFSCQTWKGSGAVGRRVRMKFRPELTLFRWRSVGSDRTPAFIDEIRGKDKIQYLAGNYADSTDASWLNAYDSEGINLGDAANVNATNWFYVGKFWDAGTSAATASTEGSITPSAQWVNTAAGFSITKWTGTNANATIGHGLNAKPDVIIVKSLDNTHHWQWYHSAAGAEVSTALADESGPSDDAGYWQDTEPTADVFSVGTNTYTGGNTDSMIAYCWTSIPGYSHFGKYIGNGSDDGPVVYTGFRPRWTLTKSLNTSATGEFRQIDTARDLTNPANITTNYHTASAESESSDHDIDILANGWKVRGDDQDVNTNGVTYAYMAFAENPFKTSRAR